VLGPVVLAVAVALLEIWRMRVMSGGAEEGPAVGPTIIAPGEQAEAPATEPSPLVSPQGSITDATTGR